MMMRTRRGGGRRRCSGQAADGVESLVDVVARYGRWLPRADLVGIEHDGFTG